MFYIHIRSQPPYNGSKPDPDLVIDLEAKSQAQYHRAEVEKIRQRIKEKYHLEQRFFI
jgi:uncharacterized protein YcgL (UPF0745 family)